MLKLSENCQLLNVNVNLSAIFCTLSNSGGTSIGATWLRWWSLVHQWRRTTTCLITVTGHKTMDTAQDLRSDFKRGKAKANLGE